MRLWLAVRAGARAFWRVLRYGEPVMTGWPSADRFEVVTPTEHWRGDNVREASLHIERAQSLKQPWSYLVDGTEKRRSP